MFSPYAAMANDMGDIVRTDATWRLGTRRTHIHCWCVLSAHKQVSLAPPVNQTTPSLYHITAKIVTISKLQSKQEYYHCNKKLAHFLFDVGKDDDYC